MDIVKPGLVLLIITCIASALLGAVNLVTAEPILQNGIKAKQEAISRVLPSDLLSANIAPSEETVVDDSLSYYTYMQGERLAAAVIEVAEKGYGGKIKILVGIGVDGKISGIDITDHSETPGLGANATGDKFRSQFVGKSGRLTVVKTAPATDTDIEAITSATITSNAVTKGVNRALEFYAAELEGNY